jgi:membrane-bound lytic murein transglycosylase D
MQGARLGTLALALCATACATAPPPPVPQPAPPPVPDVVELRTALEHATLRTLVAEQPRVEIPPTASLPIPEHQSIRAALAVFSSDLKSDIQQSLIRSAQYRSLIEQVLDEFKLPKALEYLPVIESAYFQTLTSRAGARGMWQFMPQTAREYGLRVDWWVDERADPELATRAAAAYLKDLYRDFADWPLALAAYNAGARRIHLAMAETHTSTFWDLLERAAIPRETRGYVPTFFASLIIAGDPAAHGFRMSDPIAPDVKRVVVTGPLSLRYLAEKANVDEDLLRDLNPMLRRGVVPSRRMEIRVPSGSARTIAGISRRHDPYVAKQLARLLPRHRKARHGERTITGGM